MPARLRQPIEATDDWQQLQLLTSSAEQLTYELIRPVVLFGQSPSERARETSAPARTLYRQAARFAQHGMASLFPAPVVPYRRVPPEIRQAIADLHAEYPAFRPNEIATICHVRFGYHPDPRTVRRVLAEDSAAARTTRRYPPYHAIPDPAERRLAIIRLHSEGWTKQSIAGYLQTSRETVYTTLRRWVEDGVAGLDDKSRARPSGVRKVDLRAMLTVRELQKNPELGAFRIHAALKQLGIELSPRTCGRILAQNRALYDAPQPPHEPKVMPFKAQRRYQYWTVDIRYLDHGLGTGKVYCISVIENFSRAILASAVSRKQDLGAYLMVLYAAIHQHGAPEMLISDRGSVFLAKQARRIYDALGITKLEIDRHQPWQSYIETQFNVQRRMADWHFANATTSSDLLAAHDRWVVDFNYQTHWAHRQRQDGRHSPAEVLARVCGRLVAPDELHRIFYATRVGRTLNRFGYARFRHWRVYGERGLPGEAVAVWLYGETLTVTFADEPLAQYHVTYQPDQRHLAGVNELERFDTPYQSPQPFLWELRDGEWLSVIRDPPYSPRRQHMPIEGYQLALPLEEEIGIG